MTLGQYLREKREARRWSQRKLAMRARVPQPTLCRLEKDQDAGISNAALVRLARVLGADADDLLLLAGRTPPDVQRILARRRDLLEFIRRHATSAERQSGAMVAFPQRE
jgi:transcriptional regulator with XRE-family HTH domain